MRRVINRKLNIKKMKEILDKKVVDNVLSIKQRNFIDEYLQTGNKSRSVMSSYGTDMNTSTKHADVLLTENHRVSKTIQEILIENKITQNVLAKVGAEGLVAVKVDHSPTEKDKLVPDFNVRHKYWHDYNEMYGNLSPSVNTINQNILLHRPHLQMPFDKLKEEARKLLLEDTTTDSGLGQKEGKE